MYQKFLELFGVTEEDLKMLINTALAEGGDYADLYFEHSIANMFYFGASGIINMDSIIYLAVVIAGNSVGGMAMPILNILGKGEPKNA